MMSESSGEIRVDARVDEERWDMNERESQVTTLAMSLLLLLSTGVGSTAKGDEDAGLFRKNDHVVFVGNTFAERLGLFGYFETLLHSGLPEHNLTVRDLGWSADRAAEQPRPLNFGVLHKHLTEQKASVVLICVGMTESFDGPEGLPTFENDLRKFALSLLEHKYNGQSPPRLVFVSPIPHEGLGAHLPAPTYHNESLKEYSAAVGKVAGELQAPFVNLFTPLSELMADERAGKMTFNGIHLTRYGYWVAGQVLAEQLHLSRPGWRIELDASAKRAKADGVTVGQVQSISSELRFRVDEPSLPMPPLPPGVSMHEAMRRRLPVLVVRNLRPGRYTLKINGAHVVTADHAAWANGVRLPAGPSTDAAEKLRLIIRSKNEQFYLRWRAVNGEYIYGRRAKPFGVVNFPGEMKQLDEIVRDHDRKIWKMSAPPAAQAFEFSPAEE